MKKQFFFATFLFSFMGPVVAQIVWESSNGGSNTDKAHAMIQTSAGNFLLAGRTASTDLQVSYNPGGWSVWLLELDGSGNLVYEHCFGGTEWDEAFGLIETTDGGLVFCGIVIQTALM